MSMLRLNRHLLGYEARVALGFNAVLPLLALPAYGLVAVLRESPPEPLETALVFEVALPLSVGLAAAHLMSIERDEGFDVLRRSYPEPSWWLPLLRLGGVLLYTALSMLLAVLLLSIASDDALDLHLIVLLALPPALYLLGMALLLGNLTGTYWLTAGAVFSYWLFDLQTVGTLSGPLYLFRTTLPGGDIDYSLNRWLLVAAAAAMFTATVAFSAWRRRRAGG